MIFHVSREMLDGRIECRALRNGPRLQYAVYFEPEIVMQACRVVPLHTKIGLGTGRARLLFRRWLRCILEPAFGGIFFERHKPLILLSLHGTLKALEWTHGSKRLERASHFWPRLLPHPAI